jgi:hypothetical protein
MSPVPIILSLLGLIPFVLCGLGAVGQDPESARRMLLALLEYAALVLAFSGAVHWGLALVSDEQRTRAQHARFGLSVLPLLVGWLALVLTPLIGTAVLIAGYIATLIVERAAARREFLPSGYWWLRLGFTVVAVAMLTTVMTLRLLGQTIVF